MGNTLVSDTTTVICLDDYHLNDRGGRKVTGRTALDLAENNFDLMYEQLKELKAGNAIKKPIYNHVNGTLDTPEEITPTQIVIVEGLHPMADPRMRELLEGSTIERTPCGKKLTCSYPGIKFAYGPDEFLGNDVTVLEMDGKFDNLQELIYVESHLSNTATKFYGELTQQMIKMGDSPGSDNGTGFFQTLASLKIREFYEKLSGVEVEVEAPAKVAA